MGHAKSAWRLDRDGKVQAARFVESPNFDHRPPDTAIDILVIHASSLPPAQYGGDFIEDFFCNRLDFTAHPYFAQLRDVKVSAHFLIKRGGELVQFVPTHLRAWHAGESEFDGRAQVNNFSIGIELEGGDDDKFETPQYDNLARLIKLLMSAYPIPKQNIVGHSDIAPGRKTDPGPHFDWRRLRGQIGAQT